MEEEVTDKEIEPKFPLQKKKYTYTWRNKWITSRARSIDDFIETYERLAEQMRRWKEAGIILDPDIDGGIGDDYADFCTYDEKVALKEGFEEEAFEEGEEDFDSEDFSALEFQVNKYLTVKLFGTLIH